MIKKSAIIWLLGTTLLLLLLTATVVSVSFGTVRAFTLFALLAVPGTVWFNLHLKSCGRQQKAPNALVVVISWLLVALGFFALYTQGPKDIREGDIPQTGDFIFLSVVIATAIHGAHWFFAKMAFTKLPRERRDLPDDQE